MKKKLFYVFLFVLFFSAVATAQERTITGTVRDANGLEMLGVAVVVKGENHGTQTDMEGRYSIKAAPGKTLEFSFLGMKTQSHKVGTSNRIDVVLQEEAVVIDEVVLTGYMQTKKDAVSAGVTTIGSENLSKLNPSTSVDNMLQGKAVGVDVTALNGKPGQTASIKVRGAVSLNVKGGDKSQPLYIIDGVFVSEEHLNTLNPNDVETMTVLKDAASTAIYGSRGANGVVVITTKQGKKGSVKFSYSARAGFGNKIEDPFEMMNAEEKMDFEQIVSPRAYTRTPETRALLKSYEHNWKDDILKTSQIISHVFSASGANENTSYFVSGGWDKNTGIIRKLEGFNRYTGRFNFTSKMTDKLKFGLNSSFAQTRSDEPRDRNNIQNPFRAIYLYNPYEPIYKRDNKGNFIRDDNNELVYNTGSQGFSILEALENQPRTDKTIQLLASIYGTYNITPELSFTSRYSANYRRFKRESLTKPGSILDNIVGDPNAPGSKADSGRDSYSYTWFNQLSYLKSFGLHNLNTTVFTEYTDNFYHSYYLASKGYMSKHLTTQDNGSAPTDAETKKSESALLSFAAAAEYDYDNKYFLSASVRRDGASRFGKDNRFGTFWSASVGWDIAKENFVKDLEWLSRMKLTASYGTTGNWNIPDYAAKGYYISSSYGGLPAAVVKSNIANPKLTWETQKSFNAGVDLGFFKNRLSVLGSYFTNNRKDFLFEVPLSWEGGSYTQYTNTGEMKTSGFEVSFNADIIKTENFKWSLGGNITFMNYNIESLNGRDKITTGYYTILKEGETPFTFYMPRYAGVNPSTGIPEYYYDEKDANGNVTEVKRTSDYNKADYAILSGKSPLPKQYGGFNTSISYKGIDLTADFSFKLGNYTYNRVAYDLLSDGAQFRNNQRKDAFDYWKQVGDTKLPRLNAAFNKQTDRFLQDASYVRFRTLTLGYTLPKSFVNNLDVRIFVQGQNLYTWTKFEGDPEVSIGAGESQLGATQEFVSGEMSLYSYPTLRSFSIGVDVTF